MGTRFESQNRKLGIQDVWYAFEKMASEEIIRHCEIYFPTCDIWYIGIIPSRCNSFELSVHLGNDVEGYSRFSTYSKFEESRFAAPKLQIDGSHFELHLFLKELTAAGE